MGTFRLALSLLVVGSHVTGLADAPAGGVAVAAFFCISGYLMAQTITAHYLGTGFLRFYLNRAIRIVPPAVVVLALTVLLLWSRDSQGFLLEPGAKQLYMPLHAPLSAVWSPITWNPDPFPVIVKPSFAFLPQAWSLLTEATFYLVAPALMLLITRRLRLLALAAGLLSFALALGATLFTNETAWMRSPFDSVWMFILGMLTFAWSPTMRMNATPARITRVAAVLLAAFVLAMGVGITSLPQSLVLLLTPFVVATWLALGQFASYGSRGIDRFLGNIAYGVFLGHYLSTLTMFLIAETVYRYTGLFGMWGIPGTPGHVGITDDTRLRVTLTLFALLAGVATYYGVERPMERLRARIRRRSFGLAGGTAEPVGSQHAGVPSPLTRV